MASEKRSCSITTTTWSGRTMAKRRRGSSGSALIVASRRGRRARLSDATNDSLPEHEHMTRRRRRMARFCKVQARRITPVLKRSRVDLPRFTSRRESAELLAEGVHQRSQRLLREVEGDARGGEQLGQWPSAAEGERGAVVGDGLVRVGLGLHPELERAQLRDAVLDVVERRVEQVELALPERLAGGLVAGP